MTDNVNSEEPKSLVRIFEEKFSKELGVPRPKVHDIIKKLEMENVIPYTNSQGVFVPKISLVAAKEIYEMREVLEGLASRLFAEKATHIQKQDLEDAVNAFEQTSNRFEQDPKSEEWREKLFIAKENVYNVLFDGCRNRKLRDSLASLRNEISFLRQQTLTYPGRSKRTAQELQRILNAIKDNDAERAEKMSILHVREAARVAYEQLQ